MIDGFGHDRGAAGVSVDQVARRLSRPEAGDTGALRQVAIRGREVAVDLR